MWPIILLGLLIASLAGWLFTWQQQRNRIRQLERSKEEIQIEETLVFDFCTAWERRLPRQSARRICIA